MNDFVAANRKDYLSVEMEIQSIDNNNKLSGSFYLQFNGNVLIERVLILEPKWNILWKKIQCLYPFIKE